MYLGFAFYNTTRESVRSLVANIPTEAISRPNNADIVIVDVKNEQVRQMEALYSVVGEENIRYLGYRAGQGVNFLGKSRVATINPYVPEWVAETQLNHGGKSEYCEICLSDLRARGDAHKRRLIFKRRPSFGFFSTDSIFAYASDSFLEAVASCGLDSGILAVPVEAEGPTNARWFALSGHQLHYADGPFGLWSPPCPLCQRSGPRRYQVREIYQQVNERVHWMTPPNGAFRGAPIVVSGQLFRWLMGPGSRFLDSGPLEYSLSAKVCGWYPEDAGYCFLPRNLHDENAPVLDPAVLPYMTFSEFPIIGNPPRVDAKWREEASETGLFRTLDQALGWDHDIVYILELSNTDTTELLAEDLANFRNLRELRLRGTKVQALPDALFDLRNLTRVDLRDTPVPPAELARLRANLRPTVKLQTTRAAPKRPRKPAEPT